VRQLAEVLGWPSSSKVTRFENGDTIPSAAEVDAWAAATGVADDTRKRWQAALTEALSMKSTFKRRGAGAVVSGKAPFNQLETVATFVRYVSPNVIPSLLRTQGYAREILTLDGSNDIDQALADLRRRQEVLEDLGKRFEFIIGEGALRYVPGNVDVMSAQLDRLISATDLPTVHLRIVPTLKPMTATFGPAAFVLYDGEAVSSDGAVERQYVGDEALLFRERADRLGRDAVSSVGARDLILSAKAALREQLPA
jgi:transcriptional regulator with XRE-family HTH domain